jgi:hypothetical protein
MGQTGCDWDSPPQRHRDTEKTETPFESTEVTESTEKKTVTGEEKRPLPHGRGSDRFLTKAADERR